MVKNKKLIHNLLNDILSARSELMFRLGKSYGTKRDLYKDLGYVLFPLFADYYGKYTRQDIASAVINAYPDACWGKFPEISEDENEETEFEIAWKQLVKDKKIFNYLLRADKAAGIGRYSCLLLGVNDGKRFDEQVEQAGELLYLQVFLESNIAIQKYETDEKNSRFGFPKIYQLKLSTGDHTQTISKEVHHSRVIHVAEDLLDNEIEGLPRLQKILNRLDDLEKVVGGAGEMFWRGAFQGLAFKAQEGVQFDPEQDSTKLEEEIDRYIHGLQRYMKLQGLDVQSLAPSVSSPSGHVDVILDLIAGATGIPKRILIGSERGELASSQDETAFSKRVESRKINHCEPNILRPFIDKLIEVGILPEPKNDYTVKWPSPFQESEQEKANTALTKTNAIVAYANSPAVENVIPQEIFLKDILGMSSEEVDKIKEIAEGQINEEEKTQREAERIAEEIVAKRQEITPNV